MKAKEEDYLVICEAAKFCDKRFGTGICDTDKCCYVLPHKQSHAPCTHCSHIIGDYKLKNDSLRMAVGTGNMEIKKYIPKVTVLPKSLKELNIGRSWNDKYTRT